MNPLPISSNSCNTTSTEELNNIANNIEQKLKILDIKLPKLAELADVDYFTLRKIINREADYMPNLRILIKLATFFNINSGDLLKCKSLSQYVPVIDMMQVEEFLLGNTPEFELQNKVFSDTYIHEKAFSIKEKLVHFNIDTMVDHICYPTNKFFKDGIFLVKHNDLPCFIQINTIKDDVIYFTNSKAQTMLQDKLAKIIPIAVVVKFLLNQALI